jgi:hypothetical protein
MTYKIAAYSTFFARSGFVTSGVVATDIYMELLFSILAIVLRNITATTLKPKQK